MNDTIRSALYARVSSEQGARDLTIQSQVDVLRRRIAEDGLRVDEELCFLDEGYSGHTLIRPALEKLRDVIHCGGIDRLYVHSPDRLTRNYAYQVVLLEEFQKCDVEVIFLNDIQEQRSSEGKLLLQMQGIIAEYERAKILERGRRGRRHAAQSGSVSALTGAPFGYRYVSRTQGGGVARFEVVETEAHIVRLIFAWIGLDRMSLRAACRRLQQMGCQTRQGSTYWHG